MKEDSSADIVFESYDEENGIVSVVYERKEGGFTPYYFQKQKDLQWSLPVWGKINEKSIYPFLDEVMEHLRNVVQKNT